MLENLIGLDKNLMVYLNLSGNHTLFGDTTMWMTSQMLMWLPLYAALLYTTLKDFGKTEAWKIILFAGITILLCDQISSGLLKPLVARPRPSHDASISNMLQYIGSYRGGPFGFPSSHASNSFGIALFFSLLYKNKLTTATLFFWATICAYSRIYLGVHYPLDILVGLLIGLICGYICNYTLSKKGNTLLNKLTIAGNYKHSSSMIVAWSIIGTICCIVTFGFKASPF